MKLSFKGQLLSSLLIATFSISFILIFGACALFYFYKGQDILFQLFTFVITGPASLMMVLVPPLFLSLYLSYLISSSLVPNQVSISLNDERLEIESGKKQINVPLNEIKRVFFVKRAGNWDRISLQYKSNVHINVGTIFKGEESAEIEQLLISLKKKLTEKYGLYYTANTAVENNHSFELSRNKPKSVVKKLAINLTIAFFAIGVPVAVAIFLMTRDNGGENLLHSKSYGSSYFSSDNGKVYALKMGDGYFELKDADIKTFTPLHFEREYGSLTGKDKNNVFARNEKIEGIDVNNVQYLGLGYTKDLKNVFFRAQKISGADVASFQSLKHSAGFNTLGFKYATDKNHVYYREMIVEGANPKTVSSVDETFDYIKDDRNAFYRSKMLQKVDVEKFHAFKSNYQIVYASDGKKHFVNGMQFPAVVNNKFWGTTDVDTSRLVRLTKSTIEVRHLLFSDHKAVYYYDDQKNEFICAENLANLKPLAYAGFTDGKYYYFSQSGNVSSRRTGYCGSQTNIYKTELLISKLSLFKRFAEFSVYKYDGDYYLLGKNMIALYQIKDFNRFDNEVIKAGRTYVSDVKYFKFLPEAKLVLKIKTRNRTNFENEND